MLDKNRFDSESKYEIARDSIDRAYKTKYEKSGAEDIGAENYNDLLDLMFLGSDESAFHGTDDEIASIWFDVNMFE